MMRWLELANALEHFAPAEVSWLPSPLI
jgi:hypothetical protein